MEYERINRSYKILRIKTYVEIHKVIFISFINTELVI